MDELPLFPAPARAERWERLRTAVTRLATQGVFIGTSSWKYPGWLGWLYERERYLTRGRFSEARFDRECLREYAEVFPTVSVDAGYYTFPTPEGLAKLRALVPAGFRLSFKVTDEITLARFPRIDRFGARAGLENPHFLDASLFRNAFLAPLEPHCSNVGVLMFEFARFAPGTWPSPAAFAFALDHFFSQLPAGWQYAVELRNPELLHPDYLAVLSRHGIAHVLNNWQAMPPVGEQLDIPGILTTEFTAARFLLKTGRSYEQAVSRFSPYDRLREPLPEARAAARRLITTLTKSRPDPVPVLSTPAHPATTASPPAGDAPSPPTPTHPNPPPPRPRRSPPPSYIFVNNRLEGHALETILAIVAD
jgi:uncharacterized protein YecE (DUF72 family)